jgi:hypothetical protein
MRQLASFLLLALALPVVATEAWRWTDDKGVVHYSDMKVPGAERVTLPSPPTVGTVAPSAPQPRTQAPEPFKYSECVVLAPGNDSVFNAVNSVAASVRISPAPAPGHRIQVLLDGQVYGAWPAGALAASLENINRGTHTLTVVVLDERKQPVCTAPTISFHVRQPSLLSPARPKPQP